MAKEFLSLSGSRPERHLVLVSGESLRLLLEDTLFAVAPWAGTVLSGSCSGLLLITSKFRLRKVPWAPIGSQSAGPGLINENPPCPSGLSIRVPNSHARIAHIYHAKRSMPSASNPPIATSTNPLSSSAEVATGFRAEMLDPLPKLADRKFLVQDHERYAAVSKCPEATSAASALRRMSEAVAYLARMLKSSLTGKGLTYSNYPTFWELGSPVCIGNALHKTITQ